MRELEPVPETSVEELRRQHDLNMAALDQLNATLQTSLIE